MSADATPTYDPASPLARGITLIEASAGTGKTYNIATLVVRLVAEQEIALREILVVTFTRAATAELELRIRGRLSEAASALEGDEEPRDPALRALWSPEGARAERAQRLRRALETFDEASISTIHGFAQRMLQQNAFESGADFGLELVQDTGPLVEEIVDDVLSRALYLAEADYPDEEARRAAYAFLSDTCGFTREGLGSLARLAISDPEMPVVPDPSAADAVTVDAWPRERDAFEQRWSDGWAEELPQAFEAAHQAGQFKPAKQTTYRAKKARANAAAVSSWLAGKPGPLASAPEEVAYFDAKRVAAKAADGAAPFDHPALTALAGLLAFPQRLADSRRARFVLDVRREFDARNAKRRAQSFQDLLRSLARQLRPDADPVSRAALVSAMGERFQAALIDEFQDTDNLQWTVFLTAFGQGEHYLYLIGDPKQAIYGFRGANVHVYLDAKASAQGRAYTMKRNYRSDRRMIDAFNHLMDRPGFFGETQIQYEPVDAPDRDPSERLRFPGDWSDAERAPLQLRFFDGRLAGDAAPGRELSKGELSALLPARVADDVVAFLDRRAGVTIFDARAEAFRPVRPGDVAVLVRTGRQARAMHTALRQAGVPSVITGTESVFASDEARDVQLWLEALAQPGRDGPARAAATTRAFGWSAADLSALAAEEQEALERWERWLELVAGWRGQLVRAGFIRAFRSALDRKDVAARLLDRLDGERRLTNLLHVAELVHAAEGRERLKLHSLIAWLKGKRATSTKLADEDELRLERDDEALRIRTMHTAKGLEFPAVWAPYLWDGRLLSKAGARDLVVPDAVERKQRILDVSLDLGRSPKKENIERAESEALRENLRLLYVALTRACHRCVVYTGRVKGLATAPLAAALHGDPGGDEADRLTAGRERCAGERGEGGPDLYADLVELAQDSADAGQPPTLAVSPCAPSERRRWRDVEQAPADLAARQFTRPGLDRVWRRYSYTALSRGLHGAPSADDPTSEGVDHDIELERDPRALLGDGCPPLVAVDDEVADVPLARFQAGADAGSFLHAVLEVLDFRCLDPAADARAGRRQLAAVLAELLPRHGFDPGRWTPTLMSGLTLALRTPLGGALGGFRLCDLGQDVRLDELRFDAPLAGGGAHGSPGHEARVRPEQLAGAFALRPGDEVMRPSYIERLAEVGFGELAGFLGGSIDLVFRAVARPFDGGAEAGEPRWYLADYKSNRLDPHRTKRYPIQQFNLEGMRWEMEQHHYYLQYHLYALALHRYLGWRLGEGYDYDTQFGGVYYLFLRGMIGAESPREGDRVHGAFFDRPPRAVIEALDALFRAPACARRGGSA